MKKKLVVCCTRVEDPRQQSWDPYAVCHNSGDPRRVNLLGIGFSSFQSPHCVIVGQLAPLDPQWWAPERGFRGGYSLTVPP